MAAAVEVITQEPAGNSSAPYIVREAGAPVPADQQAAFDKALDIWDAADAAGGEPAPAARTVADEHPEAVSTPAPAAQPADADKLLEQKFQEYRRQYGRLDAERQELKTELAEYHKLKAELAEARYNPNKLLEIGGIPQEEFTKLLLSSGGEMSPEMRVALEAKQRAESSEKQLSTLQKSMQQRQEQQLVDEYKAEAASFIANAGDDHEFTRNLGGDAATQMLMAEINNHYAANLDPATGVGPVLSYKEAADRIEARIESDMFDRYIKTKKMQSKFQELYGQQAPGAPRQSRTLTGNMVPHAAPGRALSEEERMAAAVKQLTSAWN